MRLRTAELFNHLGIKDIREPAQSQYWFMTYPGIDDISLTADAYLDPISGDFIAEVFKSEYNCATGKSKNHSWFFMCATPVSDLDSRIKKLLIKRHHVPLDDRHAVTRALLMFKDAAFSIRSGEIPVIDYHRQRGDALAPPERAGRATLKPGGGRRRKWEGSNL